MSTKIYNAYAYSGDNGIFGLFKVLEELKQKHIEQEIRTKYVFFDFSQETGRVETEFHVYRLIEEETRKGLNHPHNMAASVAIYPHKRKLYVQFFGVNEKLIKKCGCFKDFHFQNQVDKPKRITYAEWEHREKIWDEIFAEDKPSTPSDCGLVFKLDTFDILHTISKGIFDKLNAS
jgi:hypothetical protein